MVITHTNTQVKDEAPLLRQVLPIWKTYKVDKFIFFNDRSTDGTTDVIREILGERAVILEKEGDQYEEGSNRSDMLEHSRAQKADLVISIDADELFTQHWVDNWDSVLPTFLENRVMLPQYNVARELHKVRHDPEYANNYRDFVFPMKYTSSYSAGHNMKSLGGRHKTPRTPPIHKPNSRLTDAKVGFVHLQALNVRFYSLKQLYYKVNDYHANGADVATLNRNYDKVINGLDFKEETAPPGIIGDWNIEPSVFDEIADYRGYKDYILAFKDDRLITFGEQYL